MSRNKYPKKPEQSGDLDQTRVFKPVEENPDATRIFRGGLTPDREEEAVPMDPDFAALMEGILPVREQTPETETPVEEITAEAPPAAEIPAEKEPDNAESPIPGMDPDFAALLYPEELAAEPDVPSEAAVSDGEERTGSAPAAVPEIPIDGSETVPAGISDLGATAAEDPEDTALFGFMSDASVPAEAADPESVAEDSAEAVSAPANIPEGTPEMNRIPEEASSAAETAETAPAEEPESSDTPAEISPASESVDIPEPEEAPADPEPSPVPAKKKADLPPSPRKKAAAPAAPAAPKGRPRRKKGDGLLGIPHLLAVAVWLAIILIIGVSLGRMVWVCAADVLAFGRADQEVTFTINADDDLDSIADKLQSADLIRYPGVFKLYATFSHADEKITTGTYTLNTMYDYHALVNEMSARSSTRIIVEDVLIPEGFSCRQIFALLEEKGICSVADLEEYAANGELDDYWFLEGLERGHKYCLEGYLFPDTYDFYLNDSPRRVLEKMLDDFDNRFKEEMIQQIDTVNSRFSEMLRRNGHTEEFIAEHQIGIHELVTVASMIEKEASNNLESYTISSVIYNRLANKEVYDRYLNIDASIIYALDGNIDPETGKTRPLSAADLQIDSPYNTYNRPGLTPGPISNPGLASLGAALDPDDTNYYYYVLDPRSGQHHFSRTYQEHMDFIASLGG